VVTAGQPVLRWIRLVKELVAAVLVLMVEATVQAQLPHQVAVAQMAAPKMLLELMVRGALGYLGVLAQSLQLRPIPLHLRGV
jgi:hypothetical protein